MPGKERLQAVMGRLLYQTNVDAEGYPNGLAMWEELPPEERYRYAAMAVLFAEKLVAEGIATIGHDFKLEGQWGNGDCARLFQFLQEAAGPGAVETSNLPPAKA